MEQDDQRRSPGSSGRAHGRITLSNVLLLAVLLASPVVAMQRFPSVVLWAGIYSVAISGFTYLAYGWDKQQAREKQWRMPEARLHFMELIGGWPGAFLAQRRLRHKSSKASYQVVFWLIVLAYQLAAFDSLQQWKWAQEIISHRP
jgi:uncharacterized membrane protein YsdA (DUF1294 family)